MTQRFKRRTGRSLSMLTLASTVMIAAVAAYQQQFAMWDRNFIAAMEGMGYSVR